MSEEGVVNKLEEADPKPGKAVTGKPKGPTYCPFCAEPIQPDATKCIHCDEFLVGDPHKVGWTGFKGKTLWDILELLGIPIAVVVVGFLFGLYQESRQNVREDKQSTRAVEATGTRQREDVIATVSQKGTDVAATETRRIENDATISALETANYQATGTREAAETRTAEENAAAQSTLDFNRLNEDILESYFDDMSTLILQTENITKAGTIERVRTLTTLSRLDGKRNGRILQFLQEAELINLIKKDLEGVNLFEADLVQANLSDATLFRANLSKANLFGANLFEAYLGRADLVDANLGRANLSKTYLGDTNLSDANLVDANLSDAYLSRANLSKADLREADLREAYLREANLFEADLRDANLFEADLSGANLGDANLVDANLSGADLFEADLSGANLGNAYLRGAYLREANLREARYNKATVWPDSFDPEQAGAELVD